MLALPPLVYAGLWILLLDPRPSTGGDNLVYLLLARALAEGHGLTEIHLPQAAPHARYPFAFPALLAPVYALSSGSLLALKLAMGAVGLVTVVLAHRWLERQGELVGLAGALSLALSPLFLEFAGDTFTEIPFLAASLSSLLLFRRLDEAGRRGALFGALAAALVGALLRLVGVALPIAYAIALARARRPAAATAAAAVAILAAAVWLPSLLGETGYASELAARYGAVETESGEAAVERPAERDGGPARFGDRLARSGRKLVRHGPIGALLFPWTEDESLPRSVGGVLGLALAVAYWGPRARRQPRDPGPAYLLLTFALILAWAAPIARLFLPLLPFLLLAPLALAAARSRRALLATATALVLSQMAGTVTRVARAIPVRAELARGNEAAGLPGPTAQVRRAMEWAEQALPAGTVVATRKPQVGFYYSGLPSVAYPRASDPRLFARELAALGADVLIVDREGLGAPRWLGPFYAAYGAKLPLLYETGEPYNTVVLNVSTLRERAGLEPAPARLRWPPRTRLPGQRPDT
ncbi:MAG: hypothetical protein ABR599_05705 [Gemmatimonadota bacterium]